MGNSPSSPPQANPTSTGTGQPLPAAAVVTAQQHPHHATVQQQPHSRVVVDIRNANLDSNNYAVWVEKQPVRRQRAAEAMEGSVMFLSSTFQALGGVLVTLLTIQKLLEELRFIRGLREKKNRNSSSNKSASAAAGSSEAHLSLPRHLAGQLTRQPSPQAPAGPGSSAEAASSSSNQQQSAWNSIAGLQHVKMLLQEVTVLPLLRPDLFSGVRAPPTAVLLYGPPGTGKTLLAKAVAAASGASFFPITGSSVLSKWYGESEQNVRRLFEEAAAAAPAVIFIDEVDSLLAKRSGASGEAPGGAGEASRRVTNEFLAYIDGIATGTGLPGGSSSTSASSADQAAAAGRVVVIAATNAPWELDDAALSRFAARLLVPLPDASARQAILATAMNGVRLQLGEDELRGVAQQAVGYSGRDLMAVCREACMRPMRELWGNRILEGEAPRHCQQQQQLVAAITAALQQGGSSRKLRRGLERWKRQTGATWCDINAVMDAGEKGVRQLQHSREQQQQHKGQKGCQQQLEQPLSIQFPVQQQRCAVQDCQQQPDNAMQQLADEVTQQHSLQTCQLSLQLPGGVQETGSSISSRDCVSGSRQQEAAEEVGPCSSSSGQQDADSASCCSGAADHAQQRVLRSHPLQFIESSLGSCRSSFDSADQQTAAADADAGSASSSAAAAAASASPPAAPAAAGTMNGGTWTFLDLIALPADAVRPVTFEDLQWALKHCGRADSSLNSRYEEWTQQYGSGEGITRAEAWKWQPMYM